MHTLDFALLIDLAIDDTVAIPAYLLREARNRNTQ
jgi:hypothetical protein